jgi:addiction module HigA family antidote
VCLVIGPKPPVHPGEILREEFLLELSSEGLAAACRVPCSRIERLVGEEIPVTADAALRLGRYFSTGLEFWMNLQTAFDPASASSSRSMPSSRARRRKEGAVARPNPSGSRCRRGSPLRSG